MNKSFKKFMVFFLSLSAIICLIPLNAEAATDLKVHYIYIGGGENDMRGDAILLESNGKFAMIDAGFKNKQALNYLNKIRIERGLKTLTLEFALISHHHYDHFNGFHDILEDPNIKINKFYFQDIHKHSSATCGTIFKPLYDKIKAKGIPVTLVPSMNWSNLTKAQRGSVLKTLKASIGNTSIFIYKNLNDNDSESGFSENSNSIVVRAESSGYTYLFTGDKPIEIIENYRTQYKNAGIESTWDLQYRAHVVKMPHHGFINTQAGYNRQYNYFFDLLGGKSGYPTLRKTVITNSIKTTAFAEGYAKKLRDELTKAGVITVTTANYPNSAYVTNQPKQP